MRWQFSLPAVVLAIVLFIGGIMLGSRLETLNPVHSSAGERLQPVGSAPGELSQGATVYVPIYSSLYLGRDIKRQTVELAATVSVRNVSSNRSEERRVGKECTSVCRSRWSPYH